MSSTSSAQLTCLCGAVLESATLLPNPEIPVTGEVCHCNPCRYTTGSLGTFFPREPLNSSPSRASLSQMTDYNSSNHTTRYFCSTCGCHCFVVNHQQKEWYCLGGIVESIEANSAAWPKDTCKVFRHDYVLDTLDGGLTPLLLNLNGRFIPTWVAAAQEPSPFDLPHATILSLPSKSASTLSRPKEDSCLRAQCHCGGVSLIIKRANYTSKPNSEVSARYVSSDPTKYLTYLCACRSCRLSTGVSLTPWALIPTVNVFNANAQKTVDDKLVPVVLGKPAASPNTNPGLGLKHHWSSPDVCRSFCGTCGATVFYWNIQRPDELDLAVGILRAEEGSMARRWLDWEWGRCSFAEESINQELYQAWQGCTELMKKIGG